MSEMRSTEARSVRIHMMLYCCGVWRRTTEDIFNTKDPKISKKAALAPPCFLIIAIQLPGVHVKALRYLVAFERGHLPAGVGAKSSVSKNKTAAWPRRLDHIAVNTIRTCLDRQAL